MGRLGNDILLWFDSCLFQELMSLCTIPSMVLSCHFIIMTSFGSLWARKFLCESVKRLKSSRNVKFLKISERIAVRSCFSSLDQIYFAWLEPSSRLTSLNSILDSFFSLWFFHRSWGWKEGENLVAYHGIASSLYPHKKVQDKYLKTFGKILISASLMFQRDLQFVTMYRLNDKQ